MSMNVIEASGLGKRYGGTWALRDCSLAIPAGHVAALVGPNGAGKTTLLNLAVGLAAPSAGGVTVLDLLGVAFAAWTLAAFAIGVLAGMLIRRAVPAIAATLAAYAALAFATGLWLREHYITPLVTSSPNPPGSAWAISGWYTKGGTFAFGDHGNGIASTAKQLCGGPCSGPRSLEQILAQHGYTHWTSYQPGSRFWPFQWIEGGWLLALSVLLIAATVWLVRRRAA